MNTAKTTERAVALCLQQYATTAYDINYRPFQCLSEQPFARTDASGGRRSYPMVEIRSSMPSVNSSQHTESVMVSITVATLEDDDQDHLILSEIYSSVESVLQSLFDQSKAPSGGEELTLFKQVFSDDYGSDFYFGGITFEGGITPFDDDGISVVSQNINIHYSRKRS